MSEENTLAVLKPSHDVHTPESLLVLVQELHVVCHAMINSSAPEKSKTLVADIGDNLVQAVQALSDLTGALVDNQRIHQAVLDAHDESKSKNNLCDLSTIVAMDIEHSKLRKIRDLTSRFSSDVHGVWESNSPSGGRSS